MGGIFGTISKKDCVNDLFYGTDYNSHLGTKRAGMVTFDAVKGFSRSIHSLERDYFRSKFEDELESLELIRKDDQDYYYSESHYLFLPTDVEPTKEELAAEEAGTIGTPKFCHFCVFRGFCQ